MKALPLVAVLLLSLVVAGSPAQAATTITINGTGTGRAYQGVGAISGGGGNTKLLYDYAEPQRSQILADP